MMPPRLAESFLRFVLSHRDRDAIPADLAEGYEEHAASHGRLRADLWYARQVLGILWHVSPRSPKHSSVTGGVVLGLVMAVGILVTNVLLPVLRVRLPESEVADLFTWGVVFVVILLAGWYARGLRSAVRAGGLVTLIAFGMAMLTFIVVDNVFFEIVRREPEKIALFHQSGYESMRVAITMSQVHALVTVLPVLCVLGALLGGLSGVVRKLIR